MGKSVGFIGNVSGKVGNMVFFTRDGEQVVRVYNGKPSNPKTQGQQDARLRLSLAGRLSAIVPPAAIEGFGGSKSSRRSRFLSGVIGATVVESGRASVDFRQIVFSDGAVTVVPGHSVSAIANVNNVRRISVSTSLRSINDVLPAGYGERYVALFLNTGASRFDYGVTGLLNMPTDTTGVTTEIDVRVGEIDVEYTAVVYVVPFVYDGGGSDGVFRVSYLGTENGTVGVDLLTGEELGAPASFGRSIYVGNAVLPAPTQQSLSPSVQSESSETRRKK